MVDVFISYSRTDSDAVAQLAEAIERAGYKVWWDAELPPHKSYGDVITDKIAKASAAIVVWSPEAAKSEWVRAEADMARNQKKLVQTALGDIMPPLPFNQIQFADIADWHGEEDHPGWIKVKRSLEDLCGARDANGNVGDGNAGVAAAAAASTGQGTVSTAQADSGSDTPKWPIFAGIAVAVLGLAGAGAILISNGRGDGESAGTLANDDGLEQSESGADLEVDGEPNPSLVDPIPAQPAFTTGPQSFSGALNQGQSQTFSVGLNAGTSYMIVGECDQDCTDIDMWLYDENGNQVDEDVLDDDIPILEVNPRRSAEYSLRIQMFSCSIEPCGFEIQVSTM